MTTPRVTLMDVAQRAGVSRTTASFVMTGRRDMRISSDAEQRVRKAARELNYRPSLLARSLRTNLSQTIGLVSERSVSVFGRSVWSSNDGLGPGTIGRGEGRTGTARGPTGDGRRAIHDRECPPIPESDGRVPAAVRTIETWKPLPSRRSKR